MAKEKKNLLGSLLYPYIDQGPVCEVVPHTMALVFRYQLTIKTDTTDMSPDQLRHHLIETLFPRDSLSISGSLVI